MSQHTYKEEILESTADWILRRIYDNQFEKMVLVKELLESSLENRAKMLYEYEMATKQNNSWLLKPLSIENLKKTYAIYYEDFHGIPLQKLLQQPMSLPHFLAIAIELTNACLSIHQQNIVFKSLCPQNILVHPTSFRIKLLSSEYMSNIEADALSSTENPYEGLTHMSYLAPEQTGRLNWEVDYRADLYALGVIFYEMLSGKKLFQALSSVDLIYKIITKKPEPLSSIKEDIPTVLSDIVDKLLQKNPESRYQSALGLREDLVQLQKILLEEKPFKQFPLAQQDIQLNIRYTKLYGREQQLAQLQTIFQHVEKGEKKLVFISGDSGVGKSSLVNELKQSIVASKGYFINAKFDQLKDDTPFAPIILLLRNLLQQIYFEGDHSVVQWTKLFEEVDLQPTPQLINLVPELRWFTKETVELFSENNENVKQLYALIYSSIQKIFIAFAKQRLPIVLFVDDVQWAFNQSMETLRLVFEHHHYGYILLIIAYRQEEVSYPHPILTWQEQCDEYEKIHLSLLNQDIVCDWIADVFKSQLPVIESFGRQLHYLTNGNPLFVKEALISFQRNQIIYYDMDTKLWNFDLSRMQQIISNERLLTFIEKRITLLSEESQEILKLIACFGKQFEFNQLLKLVKGSFTKLLQSVQRLIEGGVIVPLNTYYKWAAAFEQEGILEDYRLQFQFVHDRIQQAAYLRLNDEERTNYHLQIGKMLEVEIDNHEDRDQLTEVVKHYNYCKHVLSVDEKEKLARWNCKLGLDSKKSGMFQIALVFFNTSLELLPEQHWEKAYDLSFTVYSNIGECECLVGKYDKAEEYLNIALAHANSRLEKLSIYSLKLALYVDSGNIEEGYTCGLEALEASGINIPLKAMELQFIKELALLKIALQKKSDAILLQLPPTKDKKSKMIHKLIIQINANAYRLNKELTGILMLRSMRLTLQKGATDDVGVVFINYALILKAGLDDTKGAYRFGRLAVTMAEQQNNIYQKAHNYFVYGAFINHGIDTYDKSIFYLKQAQQYSKELGIHHMVAIAASFLCVTMLINGHSLDEIGQEVERQRSLFSINNDMLSYDYLYEFDQWIHTLKTIDTEAIWDYPFSSRDDDSAKLMHLILRLKMSYLLENWEQALVILDELKQPIKDTFSLIVTPYYYYYRALWQMKWMQQKSCPRSQKALYTKEVKQSIKKLRKWSKYAPQNYEHLYMLLMAEYISMKGISREAIYYYDRAVQFAHIHGYMQDGAVACERAANYYLSLQDEKMAKLFIERAAGLMYTWGAPRVVKKWEGQYNNILRAAAPIQESKPISFDVMTVLETTNSMSQAIKMDDLLRKLLSSILKQAGATKGYFIQKLDNAYSVIAEANDTVVTLYEYKLLQDCPDFMQSIVRYCIQSGENVNVENVQMANQFPSSTGDEKSVLCLPVWHKGEITAILYLENHVSWNAFNEEKVEILKVISTQIAVSLENARVYEDLEHRVEERTKELADLNAHLTEVNNRLQKNEIERKKILHSISHELRSPITSAIGYVEAILDGVVQDEQQKTVYLQKSKSRLLSLNRLIQDLFDLANLEAGRMEFQFSKVSVLALFNESITRYEDEIHSSGLQFVSECKIVDDILVMVDEQRIEQVLTNLMRNAIKYTKQGKIRLEVQQKDRMCVFSVEDSGIGIPKNEIDFVFDSYFGGSNNSNVESHGIGLAICKQIITQHGGEISVESMEQKGSKFNFTLPIVGE